jgi:hypothetical protein
VVRDWITPGSQQTKLLSEKWGEQEEESLALFKDETPRAFILTAAHVQVRDRISGLLSRVPKHAVLPSASAHDLNAFSGVLIVLHGDLVVSLGQMVAPRRFLGECGILRAPKIVL